MGHDAVVRGDGGAMPALSNMIILMKFSGSWFAHAADRTQPLAASLDSKVPRDFTINFT